jgi:spermidine/putrescine transport system substrate-binding protein
MKNQTKALASGFALLMASASFSMAEGQLNIYNWGNYTSPELIEKFQEETGITVTVTDYDSNDTALTRIKAGGHGFDIVVPSASYVPIWVADGLLTELDHSKLPNIANLDPQWVEVPFDEGRTHTIPWLWGTTGVIVNTSVYDGDPNTADIFLNPPDELKGKINVIPEMSDVMAIVIRYVGGTDSCTDDRDVLRAARDALMAAKPHWIALDYGTVDQYGAGDISAGVYWNGASMRARLQNDDLVYGYPATGYPIWMDNAAILADAQNAENAYTFLNYIMEPEHAAMLSNFARYANAVVGSEEFMDEEMRDAPEMVVPDEFLEAGQFSLTCPAEVQQMHTQIWTELLR